MTKFLKIKILANSTKFFAIKRFFCSLRYGVAKKISKDHNSKQHKYDLMGFCEKIDDCQAIVAIV